MESEIEKSNSQSGAEWDFQGTAVAPKTGLVVVYDLENFTSFLETPDIQRAALKYLNFVDAQVQYIYRAGTAIGNDEKYPQVASPIHRKFLGDGAMMIFDLTSMSVDEYQRTLKQIVIRAWNLKNFFSAINEQARKFMPVSKMPSGIRVGITFGTIYELSRRDGEKEYLGIPINMAARLQKYAGTAGLLLSSRVDLSPEWFEKSEFVKVRPLKLRNGGVEYLYIDKYDLADAKKGLYETVSMDAKPS